VLVEDAVFGVATNVAYWAGLAKLAAPLRSIVKEVWVLAAIAWHLTKGRDDSDGE
jgi:hypothetical protein